MNSSLTVDGDAGHQSIENPALYPQHLRAEGTEPIV
jgi:hypothetical protein